MKTGVAFKFVLERSLPTDSEAVCCSLKVKQYIKKPEDNVDFSFGFCGKRFWLKLNDNLGEFVHRPSGFSMLANIHCHIAQILAPPYPQLYTDKGHYSRRSFANISSLAPPRTRMILSAGGWHET